MQAAQEVPCTPEQILSLNRRFIWAFNDQRYVNKYIYCVQEVQKDSIKTDYEFMYYDYPLPSLKGEFYGTIPYYHYKAPYMGFTNGTPGSLVDFIRQSPHMKGILIDLSSGSIRKFRFVKPYTSQELFALRFNRDNVETIFQEWLWPRVQQYYEAWDCDDPTKDPLHGEPYKEIWREAQLFFHTVEQRVKHLDEIRKLYPGADPLTVGKPISLDTVKRQIGKMKLFNEPGDGRRGNRTVRR